MYLIMACLEYEIMKTGGLSHLSRFLLSPAFTLGEGMSRTELSNNKHMRCFIDICIICHNQDSQCTWKIYVILTLIL